LLHKTATVFAYNRRVNSTTDPIETSTYSHPVLRWVLGLFGAVIVCVAGRDFLRAIWPLSILTPFFGLLTGIGVVMGAGLVAGAIWGKDERWIFASGQLSIIHTLRTFEKRTDYKTTEIVSHRIDSSEWDSRPDTYVLSLTLRTGKTLRSPHFSTREAAETARARLGLPSVS